MKSCTTVARVIGGGAFVGCSLPEGHGGNHAARISAERKEITECLDQLDHPTTVYTTTHVWGPSQTVAIPHLPRTT